MATVYHSKTINPLLSKLDPVRLGSRVAIKVHFGEKGCTTYVDPKIVKAVYDKVISLGIEAALVECNVLYKGERTYARSHLKIAHDHGFTFAPIEIVDGEKGDDFVEVGGCKLGAGLKRYDSMIVISHFKGHMSAGFGGALKNVGMGLGSRAGKLHMHSNITPSINKKNCVGCGVCAEACNGKAIHLKDGKAEIDPDKCIGCAMCIGICPQHAVIIPWGSATNTQLQERIVDYAAAVTKLIPKEKMVFINVLNKITSECDCMAYEQKPIMPDAGILLSTDIVSIDKAAIDLADKVSGGKFSKINGVDKEAMLSYAVKRGLGKLQYELVELE